MIYYASRYPLATSPNWALSVWLGRWTCFFCIGREIVRFQINRG